MEIQGGANVLLSSNFRPPERVGFLETMQMKHLIPCLWVVCAMWASPGALAQEALQVTSTQSGKHHSGPQFEAFVASEGWIFIEDQTKGAAFPDLQGTPSVHTGGQVFNADEFDPETFDPRDFAISYGGDVTLPTNFRVGDRGMLQFHSPQRCQDLYERHLARKAKGQ